MSCKFYEVFKVIRHICPKKDSLNARVFSAQRIIINWEEGMNKKTKIKPLFDRVIVKIEEETEHIERGVILVSSSDDKAVTARIIEVGTGLKNDDNLVVSCGEKIVFSKYSGIEFKLDGESVVILKQSDILAKIREE